MPAPIWTSTLEAFCDRLATIEPAPAGVTAAAVSATFGLGLLIKVLEIASKRRDFAGDAALAAALLNTARKHSAALSRLADDDIIAFQTFLECRRQKQPLDAAIRRTIAVPLAAARTASAALDLCAQASGLIHAAVAPDLGTAVELLRAAVRSTLLTVHANLAQLPADDPYRIQVAAESEALLKKQSAHG